MIVTRAFLQKASAIWDSYIEAGHPDISKDSRDCPAQQNKREWHGCNTVNKNYFCVMLRKEIRNQNLLKEAGSQITAFLLAIKNYNQPYNKYINLM